MPQFYASTSKGLSEPLANELRDMGLKVGQVDKQGCYFEGPWSDCAKANLRSRIATRISLPILDFHAYKADELYDNVKKHDFTKYLTPKLTFSIKAKLNDCAIKDQRILAMKVKDVIADQFNEKFNVRPSVDKKTPSVRFFIFGSKNEFRLSVDTSGHSLSQRGYRVESVEAPMREHVAAGLISLSGWDKKTPIIDPMCGSGTILIEAALMLKNVSPGTFHKKFSFQNFEHVPENLFDSELEKVLAEETDELPDFKLYGFDKMGENIRAAKQNAENAGVEDLIVFERGNAVTMDPPVEKGIILTNPPYGIRMGEEFFLEELYRDFSHNLKTKFSGWEMFMLSGDAKWTQFLKMKAQKRFPIDNGGIDCRWIHYKMNQR
jgi:23S rRNA (guanine2445-N2)-methyltransferase / 23S rRNA (guanine2069-N7)-methyltransferase